MARRIPGREFDVHDFDTRRASKCWLADGKTITTGLASAYLAVELTKFVPDLQVKTGDAFALPLAVGRWGCFLNGCCYFRLPIFPRFWASARVRASHTVQLCCITR